MKRIFLAALIILSGMVSLSQHKSADKKTADTVDINPEKLRLKIDSQIKATDSIWKMKQKVQDSLAIQRMTSNTNGLVSMMRERDRAQRKQMWLRLGLGVAFLALGIYGVMRKRKKAKV